MTDEITRLIGSLDDESTGIAEDAKTGLMSIGGEVLPPLTAAVRSLDRYGQLSAAEVFEHLGDPAGNTYWNSHERLDQPLNLGMPWPDVVDAAGEAALIEAAQVDPHSDLSATIEWVDHADL
ncbi:hypothetical protein [Actinoplanes sp. NPDC049802]|uniref:hypothetical protein n=1 Tax=Actinoplanes sp. NPDC049802 TaxID=3154742 RepID=UPI0033C025D1